MNAPFYIEVLSTSQEVKQRYRFEQLPITLGRGYGNDLMLDDRYIAPEHAVIEVNPNGSLLIRDVGSRNGIIYKGKRGAEFVVDGNSVVRLGHTNLRIRSADFSVLAEVADKTAYGWEGWPPALAGIFIVILLSLASVWVTDTEKFSAIRYSMATALILGIVMLWCGAWSFANRVFGNGPRLGRHLFVVACGLLVMDVWDLSSITTAYAFSWEWLTRYNDHVLMLISAGIVFFHLITIHPQHPRRFVVVCGVLTLIGSGLIFMNNYQRDGRLADELYMSYILPPETRLSRNQSVEQFINDARVLKSQVDTERLKPVKNNMSLLDDEFKDPDPQDGDPKEGSPDGQN